MTWPTWVSLLVGGSSSHKDKALCCHDKLGGCTETRSAVYPINYADDFAVIYFVLSYIVALVGFMQIIYPCPSGLLHQHLGASIIFPVHCQWRILVKHPKLNKVPTLCIILGMYNMNEVKTIYGRLWKLIIPIQWHHMSIVASQTNRNITAVTEAEYTSWVRTHKQHPMFYPNGWAMECLLIFFFRKLT